MTEEQLQELTRLFMVAKREHPDLRDGQSWMNALSVVNIDMYEKITGTIADCFYDDTRIALFFTTLYT